MDPAARPIPVSSNPLADYQGKVFASISLRAEKDKCVEVAKKETDKALTILRFFSPSALLPEIPSYFGRMGHVDIPSNHIFIFEDELPVIHKEIAEKSNPYWRIRRDQILEFEKYGLANANEIITKEKPTKFDDVLLNSISLFTRGIRSKDIHDKLVFTLVSLETMLLKNETEPIQSSIGLRLAFLTASSISDRKKVIKCVKDAYQQRSRYIHHGRQSSTLETLKDIQNYTWTALIKILHLKDNFISQESLIDSIEDKILSG
jgi:hypothetical protein